MRKLRLREILGRGEHFPRSPASEYHRWQVASQRCVDTALSWGTFPRRLVCGEGGGADAQRETKR